jgi:hypothetical protein
MHDYVQDEVEKIIERRPIQRAKWLSVVEECILSMPRNNDPQKPRPNETEARRIKFTWSSARGGRERSWVALEEY